MGFQNIVSLCRNLYIKMRIGVESVIWYDRHNDIWCVFFMFQFIKQIFVFLHISSKYWTQLFFEYWIWISKTSTTKEAESAIIPNILENNILNKLIFYEIVDLTIIRLNDIWYIGYIPYNKHSLQEKQHWILLKYFLYTLSTI